MIQAVAAGIAALVDHPVSSSTVQICNNDVTVHFGYEFLNLLNGSICKAKRFSLDSLFVRSGGLEFHQLLIPGRII